MVQWENEKDAHNFVPLGGVEQAIKFFVSRPVDAQTASLEDDAFVTITIDGDLSIGRVARVDVLVVFAFGLVTQLATVCQDATGVCVDSQSPAGDVGLVRPLIAKVTIAASLLPWHARAAFVPIAV